MREAKKFYPNAPRVEVKIMTGDSGFGWVNKDNIIAIGEDLKGDVLVHVVLHELVHTWFKIKERDLNCPLMKPNHSKNESAFTAWETFKKIRKKLPTV